MYAICRTTHPPTPVEHSTYCHFFSRDEPRNLVTAGANQLKVYRLVRVPTTVESGGAYSTQSNFSKQIDIVSNAASEVADDNGGGDGGEEYATPDSNVKLECMQTFSLNGNIESLNTVSFVGADRDCLLLAFSEAKLSLVEYCADTHDLKTISMHYFEEDDMKEGYCYNVRPPMVRVDPENRCAAMLIYSKSIIIIPFRKDVIVEEPENNATPSGTTDTSTGQFFTTNLSNRRYPILPSYKLDLKNEQYGTQISNILDIQFLHNYYEPTLLILYEPIRTWSGRVAVRQDSVSMITLSLDVHQRVHLHIWSLTNLPFNTFAALPVPKPIGGVLIMAHNALIHLNQGLPPYGVSLNCFNDSITSFPLKTQDSVKISLDCSQTCFISNNKIIITLNNGDIYLLHLHYDMTRSIRTMNLVHLASSIYATAVNKCEEGYLFIGSRLSHSLLVHYEIKVEEGDSAAGMADYYNHHHGKLNRTHNRLTLVELIFDESKQTEDEYLYGEEAAYLFPKYNKIVEEEVPMEIESIPPPPSDSDAEVPTMNGDIPMTNGDASQDEENIENNNVDEENNDNNAEENNNIVEMNEADAIKMLNQDYAENGFEEEFLDQEEEEEVEDPNEYDDKIQLLVPGDNKNCHLRVCDVLYNIAPSGAMTVGEVHDATNSSETLTRATEMFNIELVTTCGFRKAGGVTIRQRSIKPQIETSFKLPGCIDVCTIYGPDDYDEGVVVETQLQPPHKYLILSQADSTLVFQIGQEINELEESGFITDSATILAGNLCRSKYILQATPGGVRLLDGIHQLQQFPPPERPLSSPIVHCSMADPYSALMTETGQVILLCLRLDSKKGSARLVISQPDLATDKAKISALCLYKDVSGLFRTENRAVSEKDKIHRKAAEEAAARAKKKKATSVSAGIKKQPTSPTKTPTTLSAPTTVDEEEELLYGDSTVSFLKSEDKEEEEETPMDEKDAEQEASENVVKLATYTRCEPTFWLFLVRENGVLEIYKLPDFKLVYLVKNFPVGTKVLVDSVQATDHAFQMMDALSMPVTREIIVHGMGQDNSRPHLFARFDDELFIYEVFPFYELQVENHLKIRFKKITSHNVQLNRMPEKAGDTAKTGEDTTTTETTPAQPPPTNNRWFRTFENISNYSGLFLSGPNPFWFVMSGRGELCVHPMDADGVIGSFATFNNININNGFIYLNQSDELRFAVLPSHLELDALWPFKYLPIRKTVHFISYHLESKTYAIATSKQMDINRIVRVGGEEKDYDPIERAEEPGYLHAKMERFYLELVSPVEWKVIPNTRLRLDEWEHVTCLKNILLASEGTSSGLKGYIVLGTNYSYGEDVTNRGRIWIADIIEVVPEPGKPLTKNKIKLILCKDQKGPVTAICQVKSYLLSAIGQKIYIWQLKQEKDLTGIAFIDTQIYVNAAVSLRNLILIGDIYKSISLLRYQEETRTLSLVARDNKSLQIYACEYLIDNGQMSFIVSDSERNIIIYSYQPDAAESLGGTRLLRRGDFHLGSHVNAFYRVQCRVPPLRTGSLAEEKTKQSYLRRQMTLFATLDGSLGHVLPLTEKTYRRLLMLQNLMVTNVQHHAGLNPKAFRMLRPFRLELMNASKNILDGDLIFRYFGLSQNERAELAKKIGTSPKQVSFS